MIIFVGLIEPIISLLLSTRANNNILLLDQPLSEVDSETKTRMYNFLFNKINKQTIIVTHDIETIGYFTYGSLFHFNFDSKNTIAYDLNKTIETTKKEKTELIKIVADNPSMLFSKNILFVEGSTDKKFFTAFFNIFNIVKYEIISLDTCTSNAPEVCKYLNVNYKCVYDIDAIYNKENKKLLASKNYILKTLNMIPMNNLISIVNSIFMDNAYKSVSFPYDYIQRKTIQQK